jgi:uncharacterized protein (DUF1800 family)
MPLPEFSGTLGHKRAAHLLRRATFGARKEQIDAFANLTPAQAITQLFRQTLPNPVLPIDPKTGQEWFVTGTTEANSEDGDLENYFLGWFIGQMLATGISDSISLAYSAREKIVLFLHTHFTAIRSKITSSRALYFQNQLYRLFALDDIGATAERNFKNLTIKISVDNAMLRLLDGNLNVKGSVNENYARELLELYSIGRGLPGVITPSPTPGDYVVYKEQDVQAAAKVLSGWDFDDTFENIDADTLLPRGKVKGNTTNASAHNNDPKNFSDRFGNATVQPDTLLLNGNLPSEESALDEIKQLVDIIYDQAETAKNICRKIYRFYVWSPHTKDEAMAIETAPNDIIGEMASLFVSSGYKIQPVIENLLRSQHFYEAGASIPDDNFGGIIKSPLDLSLGALRFFNVQLPDYTSSPEEFYEITNALIADWGSMGMSFFEPYDVAGYEAYHQFPIYHRAWITPNALAERYKFMRKLITKDENFILQINALDYINEHFSTEAPDANTLVVALANYLFPVPDNLDYDESTPSGLTAKRLNYFKSNLLGGFTETYWTTMIWNGTNLDDKRRALENLLNAMLQSPEYQLA